MVEAKASTEEGEGIGRLESARAPLACSPLRSSPFVRIATEFLEKADYDHEIPKLFLEHTTYSLRLRPVLLRISAEARARISRRDKGHQGSR